MIFASCAYGSAVIENNAALAITGSSFFASWFAIFLMLNVKNWMIYFKSQWTYYTLQVKWQNIINSKNAAELNEQNWFIKNNKTYGNLSYIYKLFGAFHFILFALSAYFMSTRIMKTSKHNIITQLFGVSLLFTLFIPVLVYGSIVCKTKSANDIFSIHWESKMHAKISVILVIGYLLTNLVKSILDHHIASLTVGVLTIPYALFFMNYVSTFKIINRCKTTGHNIETELVDCVQNTAKQIKHTSLNNVLSHSDALNLFMVHLSKEFSMEMLFAWIEFTQFQKYLSVNMPNDTKLLEVKLIEVPETIPISEIVTRNNNNNNNNNNITFEENMTLKARILYNKYIFAGAELEINIASKMRKEIYKILWSDKILNLMDLLLVFNNAKQEMEKLMRWSLNRFRNEPEFVQIISMLCSKNKHNTVDSLKIRSPKATDVGIAVKNTFQLILEMSRAPTIIGDNIRDKVDIVIGCDITHNQKQIPQLKNKPSLRDEMSASLLSIDAPQ